MLSVVIPAYNEEKMIKKTSQVIGECLSEQNIEYEIIFVNDGSKDNTLDEINKVCKTSPRVKGISFSRNFGKEAAMFAGISYAKGDCCVLMDCDLQHPPELILTMYSFWKEGYEVVEGVKRSRGGEGKLHKFAAKFFYYIMSKAVGIDMARASDFKLLDRKVVNALLDMQEKQTFFRALSAWVGFRTISTEFDVQEREEGETKWSTASLIRYALNNITSFSTAPMQIVTFCGVFFLLFSIILGIQTLVSYWRGNSLEGFTTIIILLLLEGSLLMLGIGIVGYYISKIYIEVKNRPRYIVSEVINDDVAAEEKDNA